MLPAIPRRATCMPPIVQRYLVALVLAALLTLLGSRAHIAELTARAREVAALVTQPPNAGEPLQLAVVQTSVDALMLDVARWLWIVWTSSGLRTSKALVNEYGRWESYSKVLRYIYTTMTASVVGSSVKIPVASGEPRLLLQSNLNVVTRLREQVQSHYDAVTKNLGTNVSAYTRHQLVCNLNQTQQFRGELNTMRAELTAILDVETVNVSRVPACVWKFVQDLRTEYAPLYNLVVSIQSGTGS